jgi:hypothetical protein
VKLRNWRETSSPATGTDDSVQTPPNAGPAAAYARILDGEHLWLAVPAGLGEPALWDEQADGLVPVVDDLPPDEPDTDRPLASVRWLLTEALAERDRAELLVVVRTDSGDPVPLRPPPAPSRTGLRTPPTPDGRWRFVLSVGEDGFLRVRRRRLRDVAWLSKIGLSGRSVQLTCRMEQEGAVRLLFLGRDGRLGGEIPMERRGDDLHATIRADDLPPQAGTYRAAVGTPERHAPITRSRNGLTLVEPRTVLMPLVLDTDDQVVGRFQLSGRGVLLLVRRQPSEVPAVEESP